MAITFTLAGVIQSIDNQLYCYDTTFRTYKEAITFTGISIDLIAVFECTNDNIKSYKFVDVVKIMNKYLTNPEYLYYNVEDWDDLTQFVTDMYNVTDCGLKPGELLANYLTYSPVPRYQHYYTTLNEVKTECMRVTPFISNLKDQLAIASLGYTSKLEGSYVNKDFPEIRNLSHRRISLPDLVFTKKDTTFNMNFANTLPSVDGVVCYPVYSKDTDELYACNGARMLKNTTDSNSLNILLIDFSKLGTITNYKLSDCAQELIIKSGSKIWGYSDANKVSSIELDAQVENWQQTEFSMKFKLPIGAPSGEIFLCLAGRLFFPGIDDLIQYTEGGYTVVEFHISSSVMENIVAANLQHQNLFYNKSNLFRVILSYVFCNIFTDQAYEYDEGTSEWKAIQFYMDQIIPFVSVITTNKKYGIDKITPMSVLKTGKMIFPVSSNGLLMNMDTHELIDYTKLDYQNQTLVTYSIQNPLYISKREGANTNSNPLYSEAISYTDLMEYAPANLNLEYNFTENRYKLFVKSTNKVFDYSDLVYGISITTPYETEVNEGGATQFKAYTWAQISVFSSATPVYDQIKHMWSLSKDGMIIAVSEYINTYTATSYQTCSWYKLLNYQDVIWYRTWDGYNVTTDNVKYDRMGWSVNPIAYTDMYNKFEDGELIKNPRNYALINICIYKEEDGSLDLLDDQDNPNKQADEKTDNPMVPVLTSEYEKVKDPIDIAEGIAPLPVTTIKVSPTISSDESSTTKLKSINAANLTNLTRDSLFSTTKTYYTRKPVNNDYAYTAVTFAHTVGDEIPMDTTEITKRKYFVKDIFFTSSDTTFVLGKTYYTLKDNEYYPFTVEHSPGDDILIFPLYIKSADGSYHITADKKYLSSVIYYKRISTDPITYEPLHLAGQSLSAHSSTTFYEFTEYARTTDTTFQASTAYYSRSGPGTEEDPYAYTNVPIKSGIILPCMYYERGAYSTYDGYYELVVDQGDSQTTGIERVWAKTDDQNIKISYNKVYAITEDTKFKSSNTYYTSVAGGYVRATVKVGDTVPADTYYDLTKSFWQFTNSDTMIFKSDRAGEGSAPYNSNLIWRLA